MDFIFMGIFPNLQFLLNLPGKMYFTTHQPPKYKYNRKLRR